ncbi:DUF4878 domain-containing protein [bacterium]|nr:DUF4878 domain-containing protein [bacterium]
MRRMIAVVGVVAVGLALVGCGGGGAGNYSSPKATAETMVAAAKAGDKDAFMACFDKETREAFAELDKLAKEKGLKGKDSSEITGKLKNAKVVFGEAKIDGDKASMPVTIDDKKEQPMSFVKEAGDWKVSIPEIKMVVGMMKGMGEAMMKGMGEAMKKGMEGAAKEMGEGMKKGLEGLKKALPKKDAK